MERIEPSVVLVIKANGKTEYASLENKTKKSDFIKKLSSSGANVNLHNTNGKEFVGELPWELDGCDEVINSKTGYILIKDKNQICFCCDVNTYKATKIGQFINISKQEMEELFKGENVNVRLELEWGE